MELLHGSRATGNHDRPACPGPTIRGDVLSSATAVSGDDLTAPASAAVPSAARAGSLAVKPDGTSSNRTAAVGNAAMERTTRSSLAAHKEIFSRRRLGAGPRTASGRLLRRRPVPHPAAAARVADTGNSVGGGNPDHPRSFARSGPPANVAIVLRHVDTPDCNTATAATGVQRIGRSPSTGSAVAVALDKSLAPDKIVDHHEVDPRERQLPKVKSWRGSLLLSGTPYTCCLILRPPFAPG
jgi:hypothetical protein